jgi:uncharacterized LabA/DUF88 family protein
VATNVYVDGFNLYYGCLKGTPYKWLDLAALCQVMLPSDEIKRIRYFTARVSGRPPDRQQPQRQDTYFRALRTIPVLSIHLGHFLTHNAWMPLANPAEGGPAMARVQKTEEKGSDVNLATYLLLDAFKKDCDTAVVISNDSDLKEPIALAQSELGMPVGVLNPHPPQRRSRAITATFFKQIREAALRSCQFPDPMSDAHGAFRRPNGW